MQSVEVWTGTAYGAASTMLQEGLVLVIFFNFFLFRYFISIFFLFLFFLEDLLFFLLSIGRVRDSIWDCECYI